MNLGMGEILVLLTLALLLSGQKGCPRSEDPREAPSANSRRGSSGDRKKKKRESGNKREE